jgi:hypothetical protein
MGGQNRNSINKLERPAYLVVVFASPALGI